MCLDGPFVQREQEKRSHPGPQGFCKGDDFQRATPFEYIDTNSRFFRPRCSGSSVLPNPCNDLRGFRDDAIGAGSLRLRLV